MARSMQAQWPSWASISGKYFLLLLCCTSVIAELMREEASTAGARFPQRLMPSHRRFLTAAPGAHDEEPVSNKSADTVVSDASEGSTNDDEESPDVRTPDEACPT